MIEDKITTFEKAVERFSVEMGLEIVDLKIKKTRSPFIEVVVDKKDKSVTTGECAKLNSLVKGFLNEKKLFPLGYTLDVCSPGLDRVLKSDKEFKWAIGKKVLVNLHVPVNKRNVVSGRLKDLDPDGRLVLRQDQGEDLLLDKSDVAKVKLIEKT